MKTSLTVLLALLSFQLFGQEFWTGTKNTSSVISRTGTTTIGYTGIRTNTEAFATIIEHTNLVGNLYIRSVISASSGDVGNLILNDQGGNVGIGTSTPQAKLSVNGNILAKEIKVKTDISIPDYVFTPAYRLPTLQETAEYIKRYGHLPEVPSAQEIAKDGVDLAAMNLLLLKKVEELTIHLILKDKQLKQQATQYMDLKKRMDILEKRK